MVSAGMSHFVTAHSGVYCITEAANSSKPTVFFATKSASYRFSLTMTCASASRKARSPPGRMGSHSRALAAVLVKRGSQTTTVAPLEIARIRSCVSELEIASSRLRPVYRM